MGSQITDFFNGQNIFLTGATGYLGKLFMEQLLRKCDPNKLYLLIRTKKGVGAKERLDQLFEDPIYDKLRKEKEHFTQKIELVNGDLSETNLGVSEEFQQKITENVNIVIHGGATVRFDECIRKATNINVRGTIAISKLCHQIRNLKAFVYVSTAFSNCPHSEIKEEFYDPPITCDELISIVNTVQEKDLHLLYPRILYNWPNVYAFTKAMAENAIKVYGQGLPVTVFRPAIIIGTFSEPIPGWIDNIYGPTGLLAGTALGVLRVLQVDEKAIASIVPGDMVVSAIMATTYKTSQMGPLLEIPIYNYVPEKENPLTWGDYVRYIHKLGSGMPLQQAFWPFSVTLQPNPYIFALYSFFLHFIPALFVDLVLFALNRNTGALKMYRKGTKFMGVLAYFATKSWKISNNNVQALWDGLNNEDRRLFNFSMKSLDWESYFKVAVPGVRLYIFKETPDTIPHGIRKQKRQKNIQKLIKAFFYGLMLWIIWKYLFVNKLVYDRQSGNEITHP